MKISKDHKDKNIGVKIVKPRKLKKILAVFLILSAVGILLVSLALILTINFRNDWAKTYSENARKEIQQKDFKQAHIDLEKAKLLSGTLGEAYLVEGIYFEAQNDSARAILSYKKAYELNSSLSEAAFNEGKILWQEKS